MTSSQVLDIAIVVVAFLAAVSGWRSGALGSLMSFIGVILGAAAGILLAPHVVGHLDGARAKTFATLFLILALVVIGEVAGVVLGRAVRGAISSRVVRTVDSLIGVVLQIVVVLVAAWLLALAIGGPIVTQLLGWLDWRLTFILLFALSIAWVPLFLLWLGIFEESKESYYETLEASSQGWHEAAHDIAPWLDYFLGALLRAYKEFEERVGTIERGRGAKGDRVRTEILKRQLPFSISEIEEACPGISVTPATPTTTPMRASTTRMATAMRMPAMLSTGDHTED